MNEDHKILAEYMSEISELAYCAGWMHDLEYMLWRIIVCDENDRLYGRYELSDADIGRLRLLSDKCKGWIYFDEVEEEKWISNDDWNKKYNQWKLGRG